MNQVEAIFRKTDRVADFAKGYLGYVGTVLSQMNVDTLAAFIQVLLDARERGSTVYFMGNGGSAATASHFVNDIVVGTRSLGKPFRAICLSDNIASLTAIANDYSYEDVFVIPLRSHLNAGDVVVAISASGNSPNVVKAVEYAKQRGVTTVGLTGFDGGKLLPLVDVSIHVPSNKGEYGPVEDLHMVVDHLAVGYLMQYCARES